MMRRTFLLVALVAVAAYGCSLFEPPDPAGERGNVSLRLVRSEASSYTTPGGGASALALALPVSDSIQVKVYPPGTGGTPEVGKGIAIPLGTDTIEVSLSVIAENNKRVAVELFAAGSLLYFGVDTNVDVVPDGNTQVTISTAAFAASGISIDKAVVGDGELFNLMWNSTPGATSYRIQESLSPDFSSIQWQSDVPDTFASGPLAAGDYYFRVRAQNLYTHSDWGTTFPLHVYGAPQVIGISAPEAMRGDVVDIVIFGSDLDHPTTQVTAFGQPATIFSWQFDQLQVRAQVPVDAMSAAVTVSNDFGTTNSTDLVMVQTIAYLMGDVTTGDWASANAYKSMIDAYGEVILNSVVLVVPYTLMDFLDMSVFEVIIVGWDTGTNETNWAGGDPNRRDAVINSGAMVLGIGAGGAAYFEAAGLNIGIRSASPGFGRDVFVTAPAADIYNNPNVVPIPGNRTLDIYTVDVVRYAVNVDVGNPPNGVSVYASQAPLSPLFPFLDQLDAQGGNDVYNFLWGFHASPLNLSAEGADIFENVIKFLFDNGTKGVIVP